MRLTQIASELGVDPIDAYIILMQQSDHVKYGVHKVVTGVSIYSMNIPEHLVKEVRTLLADTITNEVIDHVKSKKRAEYGEHEAVFAPAKWGEEDEDADDS